jgi:selenocysteine lyase/cysteine desulfurase
MATASTLIPTVSLQHAAEQFGDARGYLAVASIGLPPRAAVDALRADLDAWYRADRDPQGYDQIVANTRDSYGRLVGIGSNRIAAGSQTSVFTSLLAAAVPAGAEVLCVEGDFSSIVYPFLQRPDIRVRSVPLAALAESISDETWLVSFSLVQSATGIVADTLAIATAATAHGALTYCDVTQAAGVLPVDATMWDATVCHTYKWLCSPRGVAFLTVSTEMQEMLTPMQAGWYAGDDVWQSCYGPAIHLANDARRFDVSPAWQAWVGAEQSISLFASLDIPTVWAYTSGLGDQLCDALGIPQQHQAIVTWADPDKTELDRLIAAGIRASGRAGRLRASFHLWNTEADVTAVIAALRS